MEQREVTKVYSYLVYDPGLKDWRVARHKASRDTVLGRPGCQLLEGTAQEVTSDELDERGQYRRLATGWGEMG